jgi:non-ribosomal peptide synthetase component F
MRERPGLTEQDILLGVTTLSFDIAGLELYLPLSAGAQVVLAGTEVAADGPRLLELLDNSRATVMQATPATWRLLLEAGWREGGGLKILCGGEAMSRDLADQLLNRASSVWNMYGPTETTIWSAIQRVEPGGGAVFVGRPIDNTQIYILDSYFNPAPIGVPGAIKIAQSWSPSSSSPTRFAEIPELACIGPGTWLDTSLMEISNS